MKPMLFCMLFVALVWTAPGIAADQLPAQLAGTWLVTLTTADDDPYVVRGNCLLLLQNDCLILAESFPMDDSRPYADAFRTSASTMDGDKYSAVLHIPAVEPSCYFPGKEKTETSIEFLVGHKENADRLTVNMSELTLKARRLRPVDAAMAIQALLREPDLMCDESVRKKLTAYVALPLTSKTDEL